MTRGPILGTNEEEEEEEILKILRTFRISETTSSGRKEKTREQEEKIMR